MMSRIPVRQVNLSLPSGNKIGRWLKWFIRFAGCIFIIAGLLVMALWGKSHIKTLNVVEIAAINPPIFDFGTVLQAQTISHSFALVNQSDRELCVVAIKPSCTCTVVRDEALGKTIPPGGHLTIPVDFAVGERQGSVSSFVSIFVAATNAMKNLYEVQAHMQGNALPEFTIEPDAINFGSLKPGEQVSKTVAFMPGNAKNLEISDPVSTVKEFQVSLQKPPPNQSHSPWIAVITFRTPTNTIRQETLSDVMQFKTSSERVPKASLYVVARIIPDMEIIPDMIIVPSSGLSEGGQTELTVRTSEPSRVMHLTMKDQNASLDIQSSNNLATSDIWNKIHHLKIPNALLTQAIGVGVELEVHDGADRIEARSAFVPIKSLYLPKGKNNES